MLLLLELELRLMVMMNMLLVLVRIRIVLMMMMGLELNHCVVLVESLAQMVIHVTVAWFGVLRDRICCCFLIAFSA